MSKREANFGGVGGQSSPFSPGASPIFRGKPSGSVGYGVNDFSSDSSMDDIMGRFRNPNILGNFERPLENLLETFHSYLEDDIKEYLLSPEEREQLKRKKKIRDKEQHIKDLSNKKPEQQLDFIKNKLETIEDLLENFRKNTNIDFGKSASSKFAADSYRRTPIDLPTVDETLTDDEEWEDNELAKARLTEPFTGIAPQYELGKGVDKYIEDLNNPTFPDNHNMQNATLNINYEMESQSPHSYQGNLVDESSPITPKSIQNNQTLESKLQALKKAPKGIGRLDPDMFYGLDWDEKLKGRYPQRGYTSDTPWGNDTMGGNVTNEYPDNSNNPYFGVIK